MKRKIVSGITLTLLLIGVLTLAFNIQPVKADPTVYSSWLTSSVTFDGEMTTPSEWSDTIPVDITLLDGHGGPGTVPARVWMKNDNAWLYVLYRVQWPAGVIDPLDAGYIGYFWDWSGEPPPLWNHSDLGAVQFDNVTLDLCGWDETRWYNDTDALPAGENNVEGAVTHDGSYYWFEFRKELNSSDGYDWAFTPGQVIETVSQVHDLLIGAWDESTGTPYQEYISLHLSAAAPPVGAILPLSGDLATFGENSKVAIDLATEEVNAFLQAAGVNWTLEILIEDGGTDPVVALEKAEYLHARGTKFIIGPQASDAVSGIKDYCDANEILVISPSSTRPGLNKPDDFLFRFCPTDLIQGPATARLITDDNVTKVIAVYRYDAWGKGLHDATKARFEALGGEFIGSIGYDPEAPGFDTIAAALDTEVTSAIATYGADKVGVLYIGFEEVVEFFTECSMYSSDGWGVKWYGSDGTTLSWDMIADTTTAHFSYQTRFINPIFSPTRSDKWQRVHDHVYAELGRSPDSYAYAAYDIVWVLALSLLEVGAYDSGAVRAVLPTVARNYFGASGWIVLDENGDRASVDYDLWIIDLVDTTYEWKYVGKYIFITDSIIWGQPSPVYVFEPVWNSKIFYVVTESNSIVSDYYFNPDEVSIRFNVTGPDGTLGFCRVAIPKQLLWVEDGNWTVLVDGDPVDATVIKEDDYYTHLYFTYGHSTKTVEIYHMLPAEHDLAVSLDAPSFLEVGDSSLLKATVRNRGLSNETNVELFLLINGTAVNSTTISELLTGASYTINYLWTPTVEATYNVTTYAPPVPDENITANNWCTKFAHAYVAWEIPADINGDGTVDIHDVVIAALAFGSRPGDPNWNPCADLNNDGLIDIFDLVIIGIHYGETYS